VADRIRIDDFDEDEVYVIHTPYISKIRKEDIRYSDGLYIPCSFGRDVLVSFREDIDLEPGYLELIKYVTSVIDKQTEQQQRKQVDITRYLQFREN
jgi:hypothetical protein